MTSSRPEIARKSDHVLLRNFVTAEIKKCAKSREQIADEMTALLSVKVTARMLSSFTAESKERHRFPLEFALAFCEVVGSYRLIRELAKRAGFRMVGPEEERLIVIGRAWEQKRKAEFVLNGGKQ